MNGCIVKIGHHYYRMRDVSSWCGGLRIAFDLLYWVEEALVPA